MAFAWLHADVPADYQATFHEKALAMYKGEVRQRATLLMHLGYTQAEAIARCCDNLAWDFSCNGGPIFLRGLGKREIGDLVRAVYRRSAKG